MDNGEKLKTSYYSITLLRTIVLLLHSPPARIQDELASRIDPNSRNVEYLFGFNSFSSSLPRSLGR